MDVKDIVNLHFSQAASEHYWWLERYALKLCESPIERLMLSAISLATVSDRLLDDRPYIANKPYTEESKYSYICPNEFGVVVYPQSVIGKYRVDFLILYFFEYMDEPKFIVVECDGHDFHEKTKKQAARDKSRDRFLQTKVHKVFRFTGSEIYNDPSGCADEIGNFLISEQLHYSDKSSESWVDPRKKYGF